MSAADAAYNHDRYRKLLAEADSEAKRLAFINLLIEEKARDRLARQRPDPDPGELHARIRQPERHVDDRARQRARARGDDRHR